MDIQRHSTTRMFLIPSLSLSVTASFIVLVSGVALSAWLCASANYLDGVVVASAALGGSLLISMRVSAGSVLIAWFAVTPLASFYIRFPTDRSIITFNRVVFVFLVIMLLLKSRRDATSPPPAPALSGIECRNKTEPGGAFKVCSFELTWGLLSVLATVSAVVQSNNLDSAFRIAVDTFWLPLVAFHVARKYCDTANRGRPLLLATIGVALFLFATGVVEFATGNDLFGYKGSELVREGERRVNGPFAADSSFAIICLLLFLFLLVAPRLFQVRFDRTSKLVYSCALMGTALGTLMPLFRAVALALAIGWVALRWFARRSGSSLGHSGLRVVLSICCLSVVIAGVLFGWTGTPAIVGGRLADPRTAFGRLATWRAAAEITLRNPVFGVGLENYAEYYDATHYYADEPNEEVLETAAAQSPHSNVFWISSELGTTGLALYIAANAFLFSMGWRALKLASERRQRLAASCFLSLMLAYWIPGLTLASGYYSDLNLYFFFLLGMLSNQFSSSGRVLEFKPSVDFSD